MQVNHNDGPNNLTYPAHFSLLLLMTPKLHSCASQAELKPFSPKDVLLWRKLFDNKHNFPVEAVT